MKRLLALILVSGTALAEPTKIDMIPKQVLVATMSKNVTIYQHPKSNVCFKEVYSSRVSFRFDAVPCSDYGIKGVG